MTRYEILKCWLVDTLEAYRNVPHCAPKRIFIDKLIATSNQAACHSEEDKRYHNLVVLRYLTDTQLSVHKICKALRIGRDKENYDHITENAIDRLLILAFGLDGINWK